MENLVTKLDETEFIINRDDLFEALSSGDSALVKRVHDLFSSVPSLVLHKVLLYCLRASAARRLYLFRGTRQKLDCQFSIHTFERSCGRHDDNDCPLACDTNLQVKTDLRISLDSLPSSKPKDPFSGKEPQQQLDDVAASNKNLENQLHALLEESGDNLGACFFSP